MKRFFISGILIMLGAGLIFMLSCGDDDTTSSDLKQGDPNDPAFQIVSALTGEGNFEFNLNLLEISFDLIERQFPVIKRASKRTVSDQGGLDSLKYSYSTSGYWHIFACTAYVTDEDMTYYYFEGIDSLRFADDEGYVYHPVLDEATSMNMRAHFAVTIEGADVQGHIHSHGALDLDGSVDTEDFTVNGQSADSVELLITEDTASCIFAMYLNQTVTDVFIDAVVQNGEGCPLSGSINLNFSITAECEGVGDVDALGVEGAWAARFIFSQGSMTATYENATTRWTVTEPCRDSGAARLSWIDALRERY